MDSTTREKVADFIWDRIGNEIVECSKSIIRDAFDVIGKRVTETLGECNAKIVASDSSYSSISDDDNCSNVEGSAKKPQHNIPSTNETSCRYCEKTITKNGVGGHEKRCAVKCGKQWVPRGEDPDFIPNMIYSPKKMKQIQSSFDSLECKRTGTVISKEQRPVRLIHSFDTIQKPTGLSGRLLGCVKYVDDYNHEQKDDVKQVQSPSTKNGTTMSDNVCTLVNTMNTPSVIQNMVGTDEVFQCVVLHPYRMAQILGAHPRETRISALKDYWEYMDPEGFRRARNNVQPIIDGCEKLKECVKKVISIYERGTETMDDVAKHSTCDDNMKKVFAIIQGIQDINPISHTQQTNYTVETNKKMGRVCEKIAISKFEKERSVHVGYQNTTVLYDTNDRIFEPCGVPNHWRLKGVLDGRLDKDTIIEVKTRRYGIKESIPIQDMYQIQTYIEMFNVQKCVHIEYHDTSGTLRERTVMRDKSVWEKEIQPGIEMFVKNIQMLLTKNPIFNYYKTFIILA